MATQNATRNGQALTTSVNHPDRPSPPKGVEPHARRSFAIVNLKGGVGKTTASLNLAAVWAEQGKRVLLIDLDPSAALSVAMGLKVDEDDPDAPSTYSLLRPKRRLPLKQVVQPTPLGLDLVPASQDLDQIPFLVREDPTWSSMLGQILEQHPGYDLVVLDCPPESIVLTYIALGAATDAVVVLQPEGLAVTGSVQMIRRIDTMRKANPTLSRQRLVINMAGNQRLARDYITGLHQEFPDLVCSTVVPRRINIAEAMSAGLPVTTYDPHSPSAEAFHRLAYELLQGGAA